MARVYRFSGYAVDPNYYWEKDSTELIESLAFSGAFSDCIFHQVHMSASEKFEWDESDPMNFDNCDLAHLESHFPRPENSGDASQVVVGGAYRHFKEGKIVTVLAVARHTETSELLVVYSCSNGVWVRPLGMFLSEVDHEKYPNAKQKMRFELVGVPVCEE